MNKISKISGFVFFALFCGFLVLPSKAHAESDLTKSMFLCKLQKTVRTLRVEIDKEENLCRAIYTKQGVDDVIGSGQYQQSCANIAGNVRRNLEGAGWKCREVNMARTSEVITLE